MAEVGKRGRKGRNVEKTGEKRPVQIEGEECVRVKNAKQRDSKDKREKKLKKNAVKTIRALFEVLCLTKCCRNLMRWKARFGCRSST